jgi:hypothetical protein
MEKEEGMRWEYEQAMKRDNFAAVVVGIVEKFTFGSSNTYSP